MIFHFIKYLDNVTFSNESDTSSETQHNILKFIITCLEEEWKSIQPRPKTYQEKYYPRNYLVFSTYDWSNLVQKHFFCTLVYHVIFCLKSQRYKHSVQYL